MNDVTATIREGFAAGKLGLPYEANPYRKALHESFDDFTDGVYGIYARYAANWDSGWIQGNGGWTQQS